MLLFCWILPGISLIGGLFLAYALTSPAGGQLDFLAPVIFLSLPLLTTIGCGIMFALIKITLEEGSNWITPKKVFWKTFSFSLIQIIVSPFVAFAMVLGCGLFTSAFN